MNLPPARTFLEFASNFQKCYLEASSLLRRQDCFINSVASLEFPKSEIDDLEASIFGCEPEYCIYNRSEGKILRVNPPSLPEGSTFRSCGGHIHIGHVIANIETGGNPAQIIKIMDALVGVVLVLLDHDLSGIARRKLYGGAGNHRITSYGTEYRTPSNFWFRHPDLTKIIYRLTRLAIEYAITNPNFVANLTDDESLQKIINTANKKDAQSLYSSYSKGLSFELQRDIESWQMNEFLSSNMEYWHEKRALAA